jgi:UDP-N-acetylmuramyl pentapeptide phosphotransferase/UDP-N-acetylglucosamine-1-phosphate transferase
MAMNQLPQEPLLAAAIPFASAVLCAALIVLLRPWLIRYALARPNARSSHTVPTPLGGGIAIMAAMIVVVALAELATQSVAGLPTIGVVLTAAVFLAVIGAIDDLRPVSVLPRLVLQIAAAAAVLAVLPPGLRAVPWLPYVLERALLLVAILWFVNLVNFMDGLDWMTVAEMLPVTAALAAFGFAGAIPSESLTIVLALAGALIGFAPFNRPVARLFLGDVGSLPIGLLVAWCLILLAGQGHLAAALLLPLYYLIDATTTLILRLRRGEKVWVAHRTHFYQRATDNGFRVIDVVREVFALNVGLAALAALAITLKTAATDLLLLVVGALAVALVLRRFARPQSHR